MFTIGQRLKNEREARYLTIERASDETRIRMIFLQALEADDYSVMPSAAQGRGFLRNYAEYLNINIDEVIAEMQKNAPAPQAVSGPLLQVNLSETEIPPLTETQDEGRFSSFWESRLRSAQSWFARPSTAESTLEENSVEPVVNSVEETISSEILTELTVEKAKPGRRKKKITEAEIAQPPMVETVSLEEQIDEKKVAAQEMPIEVEQPNPTAEAKPGLWTKLRILIPTRKVETETVSSSEVEEPVVEKEIQPTQPSQTADVIFAEIGRQLRERRELISLTMEEVERHTKLRAIFVKALEEGAFEKLPSTVQTRGMLTNYSTFLDLDTDVILLRYADALQARRREKYTETPREKIQTEVKANIPLLRGFIAGDLVFGIIMIAMLMALGIWGIGRVLSSQESADEEPTSASIVDVLADIPLVTPSVEGFLPVNDPALSTSQAGQTAAEVPTISLNANVVVTIFSVERAFVRISVDDEVVFEGRIAPFETIQYEAVEKIEILSGNAAALRITYNGRDLGLMGNVGEVVNRVYTISGVVIPTSTPLPTATNTPLVTDTPTATITPTATLVEGTPSP